MVNHLPDVYFFNPACEYAVANGSATWQPNKLINKMGKDLDTLPLFFSNPEDYILVNKMPSANYLKSLNEVGIQVPNFITLEDALINKDFQTQPKNKLMPWGWSPAAHKLLSPIKQSCCKDFLSSPVSEWKPEYKELYSKKFAMELQHKILTEFRSEIFLPIQCKAEICISKIDFENLISQWRRIMVKAPWSASGRGLQPITKTPVHPKVWEKLLGIVNEQGYAIVEPLLDKVLDMAFEFESKKGEISFLGISYFNTDKKGQYKGNNINGLPDNTSNELVSFVKNTKKKLLVPLISILGKSRLATEYEGFFGVDMLVYLNKNNEFRINPCLEVNVRQTMGLLALKLTHLLAVHKKGIFKIFYKPGDTFFRFKTEMEKEHPLKINKKRIESGFLSLTEANKESLFGAYLIV